ncbi:dopamine receptor 2-like [Pollicipes pollicipes]|uniref:dopamine receptor 2-like n=1 Tax=Pollicipes pollicipes TaxID=41117 RepID=UPI0018857B42|nr:dopamine receptor 2-like [Pollicipes pollicipes]
MPLPQLSGLVVGLLILLTSATFPVVVARYSHLHTATNYYICTLCLIDCLLGLVYVTHSTLRFALSLQSPTFCLSTLAATTFSLTASNVVIFWLALDRHTALRNPLSYPLLVTSGTVLRRVLLAAALALVVNGLGICWQLLAGHRLPDAVSDCFTASVRILGAKASALLYITNLGIVTATLLLNLTLACSARRLLRRSLHVRQFYYLLRIFLLYGICLVPFSVHGLMQALTSIKPEVDEVDPWWVVVVIMRALFNFADSWLYCSSPELRQAHLHFFCGASLYP